MNNNLKIIATFRSIIVQTTEISNTKLSLIHLKKDHDIFVFGSYNLTVK